MSFFHIGIYHSKTPHNLGTLWRTAFQLGASGVFTVGARYFPQASDTCNTPAHLPLVHYPTLAELRQHLPYGAPLIGVEMGGTALGEFQHPPAGVYLLGAEDHGLPPAIQAQCNALVCLEAVRTPSYNVAVAGALVMYDRQFSGKALGWKSFKRARCA